MRRPCHMSVMQVKSLRQNWQGLVTFQVIAVFRLPKFGQFSDLKTLEAFLGQKCVYARSDHLSLFTEECKEVTEQLRHSNNFQAFGKKIPSLFKKRDEMQIFYPLCLSTVKQWLGQGHHRQIICPFGWWGSRNGLRKNCNIQSSLD